MQKTLIDKVEQSEEFLTGYDLKISDQQKAIEKAAGAQPKRMTQNENTDSAEEI